MDGRAFLTVATRLAGESTEADWRSAAGRAYYALFLEAAAVLKRWAFVLRSGEQIHAAVRLRFVYARDADLKIIGDALERVGYLRNQADYHIERAGQFRSAKAAQDAVQKANDAIALLDQIDADSARRTAAIATIQKAFPP